MLNREISEKIVENILLNHVFNNEVSVPFMTGPVTGYVPRKHLHTYLSCEDFQWRRGGIRFADHIEGFDAKTEAFQKVTQKLIKQGLIQESKEPHFQERAVGNDYRIISPNHAEFKINRAYYRHYGFQADGVFLNVVIDDPKSGESKILLQQRAARVEAGNTFDFAAGGAVKFPQTLESALNKQAVEELGVDVSNVDSLGSTSFIFSTPEKDWVTSNKHNLFGLRTNVFAIGNFDTEEVQGFKLVNPEEALLYCANGQINRQNVQSFVTSMDKMDLLPEFDGVDLVKSEIERHFRPADNTTSVSALRR